MSTPRVDKAQRSLKGAKALLFASDNSRETRGKKEEQLKASVDKRRLKRTGRTELWSLRTRPDVKARAYELAKQSDMLISAFVEKALEAYFETLKGGK
jgi:hypothetical protein